MNIDTLDKLLNSNEPDINKLSKKQIVDLITKNRYLHMNNVSKIKELEDRIFEQSKNEHALKILFSSFLGDDLKINEYDGRIEHRKLNILSLAGRVIANCIKDRNS